MKASELDSAGFQATPTRDSEGSALLGQREAVRHRQERAVADHVRRMLQRVVAIQPDAGAKRVGHQREDVR